MRGWELRSRTASDLGSVATMAHTALEIMNPDLFTFRGTETASDAVHYLVALGVTAAPVLDDARQPIGFVSLHDALRAGSDELVPRFMTTPPDTIASDTTLEPLADRMCDHGRHHHVCVDEAGRAVGMVSVLDVLRGLRGRPVTRPQVFSHYDRATGLTWTDPLRFDPAVLVELPHGPGVFTLTWVAPGEPDRVLWSEVCADLQRRLEEILTVPNMAPPHIAELMRKDGLQLRYALAASALSLREALLAEVLHGAASRSAAAQGR